MTTIKATVTYQKYTHIWNYDFNPLHFEIGPYAYFLDRTNEKRLLCA